MGELRSELLSYTVFAKIIVFKTGEMVCCNDFCKMFSGITNVKVCDAIKVIVAIATTKW